MTTTETRIGDYIEVYGGTRFYPLDPREDEIHIEDIAHALALTNRFSGHTRVPYSVAEHSVRVSYAVEIHAQRCNHPDPRRVAKWGLIHDSPEAYLNDIPRPLKRTEAFYPYRNLENNLLRKIACRFGLTGDLPQIVKDADEILLATEARDLMTPGALDRWTPFRFEPQPMPINPMSWQEAKRQFLARFEELTQ